MRERGGVELENWDEVSGFARSECFVGRTAGLIHPTGDLPAASRASFTAFNSAANVGVAADVPDTGCNTPSIATV